MLVAAADVLLSVTVLAASVGHVVAGASGASGTGNDPAHASMEENVLGKKMMELITLTNELETRENTETTDIAKSSEKLTELQQKSLQVNQLLARKNSEREDLKKTIDQFTKDVEIVKQEYFSLLRKTEMLGDAGPLQGTQVGES